MLEIGKTYEYEYMSRMPGKPKDCVRFLVTEYNLGEYYIQFENGSNNQIHVGSPMAEMSEEVMLSASTCHHAAMHNAMGERRISQRKLV